MATKEFSVHGVKFVRKGFCNQCGGCDRECLECPHGERREDGKVYCKIQDHKSEVCEYCTNNPESSWYRDGKPVTHQICVDFPNHPFLDVIKSGKCNYKFTPKTDMDKDKFSALTDKWH